MSKYEILQPLNMRKSPVSGEVIFALSKGSFVWGVRDTATNWIHVSKYQSFGLVTVQALDAWCSGGASYVKEVPDTIPPVPVITSVDIQLAPGSTVTTKYSDGTEKVETA